MERRQESRRRRIFALVVVVLVGCAAAAALVQPWRWAGSAGSPSAAATPAQPGVAAAASPSASPAATAPSGSPSQSPSPSPTGSPPGSGGGTAMVAPAIVRDFVPYGPQRKAEMAAFSERHYGQDTWVLHPRLIVLHYTATATYAAAHATFAANAPALGELPGVAAHFVIDEDGTIYQQVPLDVRCRNAVGLDWCAVGIEFVQPASSGPAQAIAQIFARPRQIAAGLRLVAWLQARYDLSTNDVIGHAMANSSPLFKDLLGQRNDHVDWDTAAVNRFRKALESAE
jgi:hypothetical protein